MSVDGGVAVPTWAEFDERPVAERHLRSPAEELADVLRRSRADLEAAARAAADGRAEGLRALAEQAVLAAELENALDHHAALPSEASLAALRALKDRMLGQIAATGLEVVRLRGAPAPAVLDLIEVESWRFDDGFESEVVADEIEVAVRLDGVPIRRGRVVMGAPARDAAGALPEERDLAPSVEPAGRAAPVHADDPLAVSAPAPGTVVCPGCGAENDSGTEVCVGCLAQLTGYIRLLLHPHVLFNRGLRAARGGDSHAARDLFAAVVMWQPDDLTTRSAYALACMEVRDWPAARGAWREVLACTPDDPVAVRGLAALAASPRAAGAMLMPR